MSSIKPRSYGCSLDILWFDCCSSSTWQYRINSRNGRGGHQPYHYSPDAPISRRLQYWQLYSPRILQATHIAPEAYHSDTSSLRLFCGVQECKQSESQCTAP